MVEVLIAWLFCIGVVFMAVSAVEMMITDSEEREADRLRRIAVEEAEAKRAAEERRYAVEEGPHR